MKSAKEGPELDSASWRAELAGFVASEDSPLDVVGVGNPFREDDGLGLEVAKRLKRLAGRSRGDHVEVHAAEIQPERLLSSLATAGHRVIIVDAVDADARPGEIFASRIDGTRFGFFATHNIPLKLVPGVPENAARILLVGVQPANLDVGEGLSSTVRESAEALAQHLSAVLGVRR